MAEPERKIYPPPPVSTPKEAPWTDAATIIESLKNLTNKVELLVNAISAGVGVPGEPGAPGVGGTLSVLLPLLQRDAWDHDHVYVATPGKAIQIPSMVIPPGFELVIRAFPDNTGDVYIGNSEGNASKATKYITLAAGEAIRLKVSNSSVCWVDADVANEGVEFFSEV